MAAPAAASPPKAVTCGEAITAPGHYFLASDCSGDGIRIEASGVRLKLAGHTMDGMGCSFSDGISARGVDRLRSQGPGTITGYFVGMSLDSVNDSRVQQQRRTNRIRLLLPDLPVQRVVVGGQKMNIKEGGR